MGGSVRAPEIGASRSRAVDAPRLAVAGRYDAWDAAADRAAWTVQHLFRRPAPDLVAALSEDRHHALDRLTAVLETAAGDASWARDPARSYLDTGGSRRRSATPGWGSPGPASLDRAAVD